MGTRVQFVRQEDSENAHVSEFPGKKSKKDAKTSRGKEQNKKKGKEGDEEDTEDGEKKKKKKKGTKDSKKGDVSICRFVSRCVASDAVCPGQLFSEL